MDTSEIQAAFDDVFDQAVVFHGFADYMRDYEVFVYATADPRTSIRPEHLLTVQAAASGYAPFIVPDDGAGFKIPMP